MSEPAQAHPFDLLIQRADHEIRLAEAALLFAADYYPQLKCHDSLTKLDSLARRVDRLGARTVAEQAEALRIVLVDEEQFAGNTDGYYDPRNSHLNAVLERRLGIPISLSAIWLDISGQLGWPLVGVGLPGHYVVACFREDEELLIDPFGGGKVIDRSDCEQIVTKVYGRAVSLPDEHFQPATTKETLTRMLHNLRAIYRQQEAWYQASCALSRLLALHPDSDELRQELIAVTGHMVRMN